MLSNRDLYKELEKIDEVIAKEENTFKKAVLKGISLLIKLAHNQRTNQVAEMRHKGINLVESKRDEKKES